MYIVHTIKICLVLTVQTANFYSLLKSVSTWKSSTRNDNDQLDLILRKLKKESNSAGGSRQKNSVNRQRDRSANEQWTAVFRIHVFSDLPDPDPLLRGMDPDPDPDPSIIKQIQSKKNLDFYCFVTSFWLFIFENDV